MFFKKCVLKYFAIFTGKHLPSLFLLKLQAYRTPLIAASAANFVIYMKTYVFIFNKKIKWGNINL